MITRLFMVVTEIDQKPGVEEGIIDMVITTVEGTIDMVTAKVEGTINMVTATVEVKVVIFEEDDKVVEEDFLTVQAFRDVEDSKVTVIKTTVIKEDSKVTEDKEGTMLEDKEIGDMKEVAEINLENQLILLIKTENGSCVHLVVLLGICYRIVKIHGKTSTKVFL